jgi:predicted MPP superfamily phosphohydrolase
MTTGERLVLLVFVMTVLGLYAAAGVMLLHAAIRRLARRRRRLGAGYVWARRVVLVLAAAGIVCMGYAWFVEPYWPETTWVRLESGKLPAGSGPVRLVQISDLHCERTERLEDELPGLVAGLSPDVIVFTGDALNEWRAVERFRTCMSGLAKIAPTYAVGGNCDERFGGRDLYAGTGVRELRGERVELNVRGARLALLGAPTGRRAALQRVLGSADADAFNVLLYHYPGEVYAAAKAGVDLHCAGHTHGGQVALPGYGALITLARYGKRFEAGLYHVEGTRLYVNRGIGLEGGLAPRVRFCARPEVTLFEIVPSGGGASAGRAVE